jgi:sugar phosphate isomerase/epimerase
MNVALGHGHDVSWWKEFSSVARYIGYEGPVSLEMEDASMDPLVGVKKSLNVLKEALPRDFDTKEARPQVGDLDKRVAATV